jgi:carboxyl-terminal processing protease
MKVLIQITKKAPYAKTAAELKDRWRKQLKLSTLSFLNRSFKSTRR